MARKKAAELNRIERFCFDIIEGPTGMNTFEDREMAVLNVPDRVGAAMWAVRCLANPRNPETVYVLQQILERRRSVLAKPASAGASTGQPQAADPEKP